MRTADVSGQPKMQPIAVGDGARALARDAADDAAVPADDAAEAGGDEGKS